MSSIGAEGDMGRHVAALFGNLQEQTCQVFLVWLTQA